MAGVAAVAAAAGFAWQRRADTTTAKSPATSAPDGAASIAAAATDPGAGLWSMRFDTPDGGSLAVADLHGRALLLNFWATWCPPCVKEFPMLDRFAREQGPRWHVLGLAIDRPEAVRNFLQRVPVGFPIGMAGLDGTDLMRQLGNDTGGLPFSVAFDRGGAIRERRLGELSQDDLDRWARALS